jgi:hypothetical protein
MKLRDDLKDGELKIEQFLTHLAVNDNVSPSTQNQAMNALFFGSLVFPVVKSFAILYVDLYFKIASIMQIA